ncbi:MAG: hypothetical protein P4N59_16280 [Negativicutes bacterium]|nr:hypothetical protein [Negativicutes bacterium]
MIAAETLNFLHKRNDSVFALLCWFDAGWYRGIVEYGYMTEPMAHLKGDAANWAFFPLYPILVKVFSWLTGFNTYIAGVILSTILFTIAILFILKYIKLTRKDSVAPSAIFLMAFGPYSFYFSSLYTESLFILLVILGFYFMEKEKWLICGIMGALLSATRPTGIVFELVLFTRFIELSLKRGESLTFALKEIAFSEKKRLALLLIPAGLFVYMTFLYFHVGDPLAFMHVEVAWGREFGDPIKLLYRALTGNEQSIYLAIWEIVGFTGVAFLIVKKRYAEGVFGFFCVMLPAMSSLLAMPRYIVGSLVLPLAFNDFVNQYEKLKWLIVIVLGAANIHLLFLWFTRHDITM